MTCQIIERDDRGRFARVRRLRGCIPIPGELADFDTVASIYRKIHPRAQTSRSLAAAVQPATPSGGPGSGQPGFEAPERANLARHPDEEGGGKGVHSLDLFGDAERGLQRSAVPASSGGRQPLVASTSFAETPRC